LKKVLWMLAVGLAAAPLGLAQAQMLELRTDKQDYLRYELVEIIASPGNSENADSFPRTLQATVWQGKERIVAPGEMKQIALRRKNGTWHGYFPIPFNPALGKYRVQVDLLDDAGNTKTSSGTFTISGTKPYLLPPGFSVVTDEGGRKGPGATKGFTDAEPKGVVNMIRWADFMGADAFWECIGQTQIWGKFNPANFPWPAGSYSLMKKVGQAAHDAGMKYGAYAVAFVALGDNIKAAPYKFTLGYDKATDSLKTTKFISLGCEKRLADLAEFVKTCEASPEVDYIGFDYMRTDWGGYEFAPEFVRDMSIAAPENWGAMTDEEKSLWLARLLKVKRDRIALAKWEWWRAHKVAMVVKHFVDTVKPTKPLWIFSLGWVTGHQHGQDVAMMRDAGIGFNAPMFYHLERYKMPAMMKDWEDYMRRAKPSVVIGEPVDWNLMDRSFVPAGPEDHLERQTMAIRRLAPMSASFGLFWHDLSRSQYGARGPYSSMEWAMAGAASFSRARMAAGRTPYKLALHTPKALVVNKAAEIRVDITNTSGNTLSAVAVELVDLPRLSGEAAKTVTDVLPGTTRSVRMTCRTGTVYEANGRRQMIAIKTVCPEAPRANGFEFVYLPVVWNEEEAAAIAAANGNTTHAATKPAANGNTVNGRGKPVTAVEDHAQE